MKQDVTYRNPWHQANGNTGPEFYRTDAKPSEHRGFLIYERLPRSFEVVKDGTCLTQRAGKSGAISAIDNLLDNPNDFWAQRMAGYMAQAVAA